jgi:hypothetical protein
MTHLELSKKLNTSKSNIQRMASLGMPCSSEQAARQWIEARSKDIPQAQAASTLTEQRRQKLILECQLLAIKIEREAANTEFLPVSEVLQAVRVFMRFAHINLKLRTDAATENIAAEGNPQRVAKLLKALASEGWASGAAGMAAQCQNSRMSAAIADVIKTEFCGITDEMIAGWVREISAS